MGAEIFGIEKREIKLVFCAELMLFKPEEVKDHTNFDEPPKPSNGMFLVLVNVKMVDKDGKFTGENWLGKSLCKKQKQE